MVRQTRGEFTRFCRWLAWAAASTGGSFRERRLPGPIRLLDENLLLARTQKGPVPGAQPLKPRVHSIVPKADNRFYRI